MTTARRLHHSYQSYLEALELSSIKLEFLDGEIYAMAGGTVTHAELSARMIRWLGNQLSTCHVYTSDLKVRIEATDLSTFPDATVVCGTLQTSAIDAHAITNPTLLVEVTSPSTEDYDRGEKLRHYKHLPNLQAVLIVSHRRPQVTIVERDGDTWRERDVSTGETVTLGEPSLHFSLNEIYDGITL